MSQFLTHSNLICWKLEKSSILAISKIEFEQQLSRNVDVEHEKTSKKYVEKLKTRMKSKKYVKKLIEIIKTRMNSKKYVKKLIEIIKTRMNSTSYVKKLTRNIKTKMSSKSYLKKLTKNEKYKNRKKQKTFAFSWELKKFEKSFV